MSRKLLAVAVAGALAPAAAMAQTSNVVLSGQMKLGYEYIQPDGANSNGGATQSFDTGRVANETSFLRLSGSEDLGNGLRAVFQIESEINGDVQGGFWSSRNTGVGLSSAALGTLMFGRWDTYYLWHAPVEAAGINNNALALKTNSLNLLEWTNGFGAAGARLSNVIRYVTPNWRGFEVEAIYSLDSEPISPGGVNRDQQGKPWEGAVVGRWLSGPFAAFGAYMRRQNQGLQVANYGNISQGGNDGLLVAQLIGGQNGNALPANMGTLNMDAFRFGGAWTFGFGTGFNLKIGGIGDYIDWEGAFNNNQSKLSSKRWAWSVPLSLAFGPSTIFGTWAIAQDAKGNYNCLAANTRGCTGSDTGAQMWMIGYDYALSKRTSVGADWVLIDNRGNGYYDFWTRGVGTDTAGKDPSSFYVGMRHLF